jgi:hypothetical protein
MLPQGVKYRHLILTVPEVLRVWFYRYTERLYDELLRLAAPMMDEAVSVAKGRKMALGYIVVLHTAGRSANYNPHLHIILLPGEVPPIWMLLPKGRSKLKERQNETDGWWTKGARGRPTTSP